MKSTEPIVASVAARAADWRAPALLAAVMLLGLVIAASSSAHASRVAVLLLLSPLAEEVVFRAGLQEALLRRRCTPLVANLLTALAFALAHVVVRADAAAFAVALPALLMGAVYGKRRKLLDCVALHSAMNALWLAWNLFGSS